MQSRPLQLKDSDEVWDELSSTRVCININPQFQAHLLNIIIIYNNLVILVIVHVS